MFFHLFFLPRLSSSLTWRIRVHITINMLKLVWVIIRFDSNEWHMVWHLTPSTIWKTNEVFLYVFKLIGMTFLSKWFVEMIIFWIARHFFEWITYIWRIYGNGSTIFFVFVEKCNRMGSGDLFHWEQNMSVYEVIAIN